MGFSRLAHSCMYTYEPGMTAKEQSKKLKLSSLESAGDCQGGHSIQEESRGPHHRGEGEGEWGSHQGAPASSVA